MASLFTISLRLRSTTTRTTPGTLLKLTRTLTTTTIRPSDPTPEAPTTTTTPEVPTTTTTPEVPTTPITPTKPRHLLSINDLSQTELAALVKRAGDFKTILKTRTVLPHPLRNMLSRRAVAMMFSKRSTRTRVSTEGATVHLGGYPMFLGSEDIQLGVNESTRDTATVISSMTSCLVARVGPHSDVVNLSEFSSVPVINALSDLYHPLQALTDIHTIKEAFPSHFAEPNDQGPLKLAWVGDANNILYDLMTACAKSGITVGIATPKSYPVDPEVLGVAQKAAEEFGNGAVVEYTDSPEEAVKGADVIVTDTWVSMGQESKKLLKVKKFAGYQVTHELAARAGAKPGWKFMHCLPRKPEEVSDEVFYDQERSLVWAEAENRLYAALAVLEAFVAMKGDISPEGWTKEYKVKV